MMIVGTYDFSNWKEDFMDYLKNEGHTPGVVKDYAGRIERIIKDEGITVPELSAEIDRWIAEYKTGNKKGVNKTRHYAPSSALVKFKGFWPTTFKPYAPEPSDLFDVFTKGPINLIK